MEFNIVILKIPTWTAIVQAIAAIIAVPGAIAAFVQLFMRDQQKQEQIDELVQQTKALNNQVDVLGEQLFLTYRPFIKHNGGGFRPERAECEIDLENHGRPAILTDIEYVDGDDFSIITRTKGYELNKENQLVLLARLTEQKSLNEINFKVRVCYKDLRGVKYELVIQFYGETNIPKVKILDDKVLE